MGDLIPGLPPGGQNPEQDRPLKNVEKVLGEVVDAKREAKRLRAQAGIPLIKAWKDEIVRRAKTGELREDLKKMKLSTLIRDLGQIKQILEDNMPAVVIAVPPAPEKKDPTWIKAHSVVSKTPAERERMRRQVEESETENK